MKSWGRKAQKNGNETAIRCICCELVTDVESKENGSASAVHISEMNLNQLSGSKQ